MISSQEEMERQARRCIDVVNGREDERIIRMMAFSFVRCSFEENSLTLAFTIDDWMLNPYGWLHGGLICTAFDTTFGVLMLMLTGHSYSPTVQLAANFLRSAGLGDTLLVTARANHVGNTLGSLSGEAHSQNTGALCATGTAMFYAGDITIPKSPAPSNG